MKPGKPTGVLSGSHDNRAGTDTARRRGNEPYAAIE